MGLPVHPVPRPGSRRGLRRPPGPPGPLPVAGGDGGGGRVRCLPLAAEAEPAAGEAVGRGAEEGGRGEGPEEQGPRHGGTGLQELGRVPGAHGEEERGAEQEEEEEEEEEPEPQGAGQPLGGGGDPTA